MMNRESDRERCVVLASYLVENRATVRATAQRFGISKSTVHKDVTEILRHVDRALYDEVSRVLATNKQERHLRGGEATRLTGCPLTPRPVRPVFPGCVPYPPAYPPFLRHRAAVPPDGTRRSCNTFPAERISHAPA